MYNKNELMKLSKKKIGELCLSDLKGFPYIVRIADKDAETNPEITFILVSKNDKIKRDDIVQYLYFNNYITFEQKYYTRIKDSYEAYIKFLAEHGHTLETIKKSRDEWSFGQFMLNMTRSSGYFRIGRYTEMNKDDIIDILVNKKRYSDKFIKAPLFVDECDLEYIPCGVDIETINKEYKQDLIESYNEKHRHKLNEEVTIGVIPAINSVLRYWTFE